MARAIMLPARTAPQLTRLRTGTRSSTPTSCGAGGLPLLSAMLFLRWELVTRTCIPVAPRRPRGRRAGGRDTGKAHGMPTREGGSGGEQGRGLPEFGEEFAVEDVLEFAEGAAGGVAVEGA